MRNARDRLLYSMVVALCLVVAVVSWVGCDGPDGKLLQASVTSLIDAEKVYLAAGRAAGIVSGDRTIPATHREELRAVVEPLLCESYDNLLAGYEALRVFKGIKRPTDIDRFTLTVVIDRVRLSARVLANSMHVSAMRPPVIDYLVAEGLS